MVNVVLSSPAQELAARNAEAAVGWVREHLAEERLPGVEVIGPAPSPIERLHSRWRWHFLARSTSVKEIDRLLSAFQEGFRPRGSDVRVVIDRDPVALL
jgi:primosomal protein N' (replication factor Y)